MIDEWLMDLDSFRSGIPLSPASLDKMLVAMRKILGEAKYQGYIGENPADSISFFNIRSERKREPFTMEEINLMFPDEIERAISKKFSLQQWENL